MFRLLWSNESGLSKAVQNGSAEKVLAILTTTPSLKNKEIKCGDTTSTAIHLAAEFGKVAVVAVLCEMGCDTNKQNEYGCTPVYNAAREGHGDVIQVLHRSGANINTADKYGRTPVFIAAYHGHTASVQVLHGYGANIDTPNNYGLTPLMATASVGKIQTVQVLVKLGAATTPKDKFGMTARDIAVQNCFAEIARAIDEYVVHQARVRCLRAFLMGTLRRRDITNQNKSNVLILPLDVLGMIASKVVQA
eukprot:c15292_g1_i1.p1 GENE.c15292_g1_i1~~c15292_g1_i1.p1  ORF type:complete len:261 (-),score=55.08 c15292_g1_i1:80-826(-)